MLKSAISDASNPYEKHKFWVIFASEDDPDDLHFGLSQESSQSPTTVEDCMLRVGCKGDPLNKRVNFTEDFWQEAFATIYNTMKWIPCTNRKNFIVFKDASITAPCSSDGDHKCFFCGDAMKRCIKLSLKGKIEIQAARILLGKQQNDGSFAIKA